MFYRTLLATTIALTISGCGGSGSSFNDNTSTPTPTTALKITSANAPTAAKASYEAANGSAELSDTGSAGIASEPGNGQAKFSKGHQISGVFLNAVNSAATSGDIVPCAVSGFLDVTATLSNPLTLSAGDRIIVVATACNDGFDEILDGTIDMTITRFNGDIFTGLYELVTDTTFDNLQVITPDDVIMNNGDASVSLDTRAAPYVESVVSGASMTVSSNASNDTLTDFSSAQTVDAGLEGVPYTLFSSGTLDSSQLTDTVSYATPLTFTGFAGEFPNSGELLVSGDASSVRLVALDAVNIRIDVDTDGDGQVDESISTTWVELTSET